MTARRDVKEIPTRGEMRREADGVVRGLIECACGCKTHFEAAQERDASGAVYRLFGLSRALRAEKPT